MKITDFGPRIKVILGPKSVIYGPKMILKLLLFYLVLIACLMLKIPFGGVITLWGLGVWLMKSYLFF